MTWPSSLNAINMSLLLELFIPQNADLSDYRFEIPYYEWDGIKYPQGDAESKFF